MYNVFIYAKKAAVALKFGFYTLGCKTNQYETQAMERILTEMGHEIGHFEEPCDGYVINTCSVTAVADKKNRAVIRRCRKDNPHAVIGVCGCYPQHDAPAVEQLGVDVVGGSGNRRAFVEMLLEATRKTGSLRTAPQTGVATPQLEGNDIDNATVAPSGQVGELPRGFAPRNDPGYISVDAALKRREFEILPAGGLEERTRAMLKVQDGCVNFCSYCIIPYTRGPLRSAPLALAVEQARELAGRGYREIVVTGIEIASWGADLPGKPPMTDLIAAICQAVPEVRIRLGSLEPRIVTKEFCEILGKFPNLCPQFHLSMQSGCDTVLARMKRKYGTARYMESVELLRKAFPGCAITTDMIVAFPGETEEEFEDSLAFIRKVGFADMHIFPYSRRPGTPADKMPGQHDNATKNSRSRRAIAVAEEMSREYRETLIGTTHEVLFEEAEGEYFIGHAPNYVIIYAKGEALHNEIRSVRIAGVYQDGVLGEIL